MPTLEALVTLLVLFAAVPWLAYPLLLAFWPRRDTGLASASIPSDVAVSVLIPAHNEVGVIRQKLENVFSLEWPRELLDVIVCSDGSDDGTDELVAQYRRHGVRLLRQSPRQGKACTINRMVEEAVGDAVLITDASAELPRNCVRKLLAALRRPGVGMASPRYVVGDGGGEAGYWSFDTRLRERAASCGVLLGGHGAAMMFWRGLVPRLAADTINDDYVLPLRVASKGYVIDYVRDCVVREPATASLSTVFYRAARIARGNLQMIGRHLPLARDPALAASLLLHKLPKTLGPGALALAALVATLGARDSLALLVFASVAGVGLLCGLLGLAALAAGLRAPRLLRASAFGLTSAAAVTVGALAYPIFGADPRWHRPPSRVALGAPAPVPLRVRALKRALDVVGSAIGLVVSIPVVAVLAVFIRLDSPGGVVYGQERVTYDAKGRRRIFRLYKLRSMRADAEAASGPVWATEEDPRVTRVGRFLRRSRLDELPQLWNVLRGEMSLVGPRPERPAFVDDLSRKVPGYDDRVFAVKPGITGWAQVHCGYDTSVESVREKLMYDLSYAAQQYRLGSWARMELTTIARTVGVMLTGRGAR
jgi:lipopolysaccharide/colanic/teichoic acid biosynthesis glycosyltransferase